VVAGNVAAGRCVRWACERHLRDIKRKDIFVDYDLLALVVNFFRMLKHWKGEYAGKPMRLEPWQVFIVGSALCWKVKATGLRRFQEVYQEIPRKNGKTTFAAGIALWGLLADGEAGAEVYTVATKKDQAKIAWTDARQMLATCPQLAGMVQTYVASMSVQATGCRFQPLGRDSNTLDGLNPHLAIYDEFHAWRDPSLRTVVRDGMAARRQPLEWIITTAGVNLHSVCYETHSHAERVLDPSQPEYTDDRLFAYIAAAEKDDDPADPATWRKANPNIGVSKSEAWMADAYTAAKRTRSTLNNFKCKHLNIWTEAAEAWLDIHAWTDCEAVFDADGLAGRQCYVGLDLAKVNDLTAIVAVFPSKTESEPWHVITRFFCPEDNIEERSKRDGVPYRAWRDEGHLIATPGETTDFAFIEAEIREIAEQYQLAELLFDRWGANQMTQRLADGGITCVGFGQGFSHMTGPVGEVERLILSRRLRVLRNPVMTWCAGNATLMHGPSDERKIVKPKDGNLRVDGMVALAMAVGGAMLHHTEPKRSIYEDRGLLEI